MEVWVNLLQTFGVAVVCLIALALAIWRVLRWSGENVVKPIVAKHIESMTKMDVAVDSLTATTSKLAEKIEQMSTDVRQLVVRTPNVNIIPEKGASGGSQHFGG